jgi:hypothetical protein
VVFVPYVLSVRRHIQSSRWRILRIYGHALLLSAGTAVLPFLFSAANPFQLAPFALLAASGTLGVFAWLILIFATRHGLASEIMRLGAALYGRFRPGR